MPQFHSSNPLVTEIDPAVLAAQREAEQDCSRRCRIRTCITPEGLEMLRTLTANNEAGTVLTPRDRTIATANGRIRLHTFVPDGAVRGVMLRIHGGGWAAGAPKTTTRSTTRTPAPAFWSWSAPSTS
jgi:acetyl esterase/lipase